MRPARSTVVATAVVMAAVGGLLTASASASAVTSCTSPVLKRQFFGNTAFSGTPRKTDCDSAVNESWSGAPAKGLPKDDFGVRWTVTRDFGSGGPFAFAAEAGGGIRVYLDGARRISLWKKDSKASKQTVNLTVPKGKHTLRIDFVNWTGPASVKFAYTPRTTAGVDKVKPLAPTSPVVTYDKATGKAKTAWARNKEMDLAGYRLYRRPKGGSFPAKPLATTASTSYTDAPPATGGTYYYQVRAYDKAGNESPGTADKSVATVDRTPPSAPASVSATVVAGTVAVGWKPVTDAQGYRVLRSSTADGSYTAVSGWLGDTSYRDVTADLKQQWYYKITARDAAGNVSKPSAAGTTGEPDTTAPAPVTGLTGMGTTAGNGITWEASGSADTDHYEVFAAPVGEQDDDGPAIVHGTSFHDPNAPVEHQSVYRVQAVDTYGNVSAAVSLLVSRPAPAEVLVPATTGGEPRDDVNVVHFEPPAGSGETDVNGYRLYQRGDTTSVWTAVHLVPPGARGAVDQTAKTGRSYYYVVALDRQGREGAPSEVVAVDRETPVHSTPPNPPQLTVVREGSPRTGDFVVNVKPAAADKDRGISGYKWEFTGACGNSGWQAIKGETGTLSWRPPYNGPCQLQVYALDHYGSGSNTTATVLDFMIR
ncbi:PA14 domain-containing protein [Streptomyces sp. NPDC015220]|uniref:PA14 domain-containing protein n=1 Tax=Streptomyces sp. NPDC015220 TaxID=3364947 RepID=UPI0036F65CE7